MNEKLHKIGKRLGNGLLLFFLVLGAITATAQVPLSLSQAVEKGLKNNFAIQINQLETQMAATKVKAAKKERLPKVDLYATQGTNLVNDRSPTSFINDFYRDRNLSFGVEGNWVLFDGFQGKINRERYQKLMESSEGNGQLAIENAIYATLLTYYDALLKKEALKVARESKQLSTERYTDAQLQQQLGKASNYDVLRFENALLIDSSTIVNQQKAFDAALLALNKAIGNRKIVAYQLTDPLNYVAQKYELPKMRKQLERTNQVLRNRYINLETLKLRTEIVRKSALPTISISTGLSQRFNGTQFPEVPRIKSNTFQYNLRFSANYTLFDGGTIKRRIEENEVLEQIAYLQIDQVKQELNDNLSAAVSNYNRQLSIIQVNERLIQNLVKNMELEKDRYTNGFSSALNYRTVQLEYITAQFTRLEAIYELLRNEVDILRITGGLSEGAF